MITVDAPTKTYGDRRAVDSLSFEVRPGRVTGFVGPNGSGKWLLKSGGSDARS